MPDYTPEEQPLGELAPSSGQNSALSALQNLTDEDRLSLIGQLQRLGISFAQFQSLLQTVSTTKHLRRREHAGRQRERFSRRA